MAVDGRTNLVLHEGRLVMLLHAAHLLLIIGHLLRRHQLATQHHRLRDTRADADGRVQLPCRV